MVGQRTIIAYESNALYNAVLVVRAADYKCWRIADNLHLVEQGTAQKLYSSAELINLAEAINDNRT